jgi:PKD repeat protein
MKSQILRLAAHVLVFSAMSASAAIRYVDVNSASPASPYTNWATAAATIQDAVDAAVAGDQILVTNGVYQTGGRVVFRAMTNRVAVDKPVTVQSVNGAAVTVIRGFQVPGTTNGDSAIRCVYMTNGAALVGFTLANGATRGNGHGDYVREQSGGGVWCASTNAVVSNCVLTGNSAAYDGGAAYGVTLNNCTLSGNSAGYGGGASGGTLNNCIAYYNIAGNGDNNYSESVLTYSCTTPLPPDGVGNISDEPQLADLSHLSAGSPCRGAGSAAYATGLDIDGESWAKPPSIGCDEYHPGVVTGPLSVSIHAAYTNVIPGLAINFAAAIAGRATANRWDFGDGTVVSNWPYASHSWTAAGDYSVVFQAHNDTSPGVSAAVTVHVVPQPVHYVALRSANPVAPYTSWATAANNIQDAVDAASVAGALALVTNGVYQTGGRVVFGAITNRVAVNKPVTVQSVNGAAVTLIQGDQAMRCVYLTSGAALMGFTLTNGGASSDGGGVFCESVVAVLSNCVLIGNSAYNGGGARSGTLYNCTLIGNSAGDVGGGAFNSTLNNCTLSGNSAISGGGGGAFYGTLNNCTLNANSAYYDGGGAAYSTLNNCTLTGNSANGDSWSFGGGAVVCTLNNCTLTGNFATRYGGGASGGTLNNCIVYYTSASNGENNYSEGVLRYSCTTPLPPDGVGNISAEPQLADLSHLGVGSPCRGAGSAAYVTGLDIDGESWANPPSIGCDEYHAGAVTGPLNLTIQATYTNVTVGFTVNFTAAIDGHATANRWDFGDGTAVSNRPYASHSWSVAGDYSVVFRAYNDTYPDGVSETLTVHVVAQPIHYVALSSVNPVAPYTSWATAATNVQDAVDAASLAGALVLVTNGVYQTGGRLLFEAYTTNRVAVTKPLLVRSVNGASVTMIQGSHVMRCVYLTSGAALVGFTLTNGAAVFGGGVWCESASAVVSNCVLTGNSTGGDTSGGGAYRGTLNNCTLTGNSVYYFGHGGAGAAGR